MAEKKRERHPFDAFMYGNQEKQEPAANEYNEKESSSFDWMELMKSMSDTYHSFNPYIKQLSKTINKFKASK